MNWTEGCRCLVRINKTIGRRSSLYHSLNKNQNGAFTTEKVCIVPDSQSQSGCLPARSLWQYGLGGGAIGFQERLILARPHDWRFKLPGCLERNFPWSTQSMITGSRKFGHIVENDTDLNRDFLVQLWVADRKMKNSRGKRRRKIVKHGKFGGTAYDNQHQYGRWYSGTSLSEENVLDQGKPVLTQAPLSQSVSGFLKPESPEEAQVAPLLARSNLLITRDIEWANLVLGFEQENRYAIVDVCYPQSPVGFIREQSNFIFRQLLRLRRPFVAYITDSMGNELFRVRRPFWWITSSIYTEIDVGVVHRRWHLWKRVYDLYLGKNQFAVVENPGFWNWTFTLKDIDGKVLAEIDRDWRGFGFEIFTDAGQYVIRFGSSDPSSKTGPARVIQELEVARPLTLSERAVAVALAISLDNDYFSRHGGWGLPFVAVGE
ncbi:altered inheritance rate of mitochondria protein 25 isoform X2 [Alnus glutinosa]|uniref:altered inheritance rate of mitochondria protein 25 isoform X2 n=1 Tax=Alnus glutinosa TaxID=3517 RepID=UPI002D7A2C1B|nr:altered inheritance rate of mitochondria protein 25 isoform X2 [Alnus glutinosa]